MATTYNYYCIGDDCTGDGKVILINLEDEEKDKAMYCPDCNVQLKRVGQQAFSVLGSESERYAKEQAHFKQRAKNHARSPESRHLRKKVIDKQFGVMGMEKVEPRKKK